MLLPILSKTDNMPNSVERDNDELNKIPEQEISYDAIGADKQSEAKLVVRNLVEKIQEKDPSPPCQITLPTRLVLHGSAALPEE